MYEVRANVYDLITVGAFNSKRDIRVVNLADVGSVSPFIYAGINDFCFVEKILFA